MPTVRYTADSGSYKHRDGVYADPESPEVDVDEEMADYLVENFPFGHVDQAPDEPDTGACGVVKGDGEVCGRELPCPYHSDEED